MLEKITILIPTYKNKHYFLDRVLDYYSNSGIKIIVGDGSSKAYSNAAKFKNVSYFHFPEKGYAEVMVNICAQIETPYAAICSHDDFIIPESIEESIRFLEDHSDYASAQGYMLNYFHRQKLTWAPAFLNMIDLDINSNSASGRIKQLFANYLPLFNAVHRTETIQQTHTIFGDKLLADYIDLVQYLIDMVAVINGKHKILPNCFYVREKLGIEGGHAFVNIGGIKSMPEHKDTYERFITLLAAHLITKESITQDSAKRIIHEGVLDLELWYSQDKIPALIHSPIRPKLLKMLVGKLPYIQHAKNSYSRFVTKKMIAKREQRAQNYIQNTSQSKGFPNGDPKAKLQWENIASYILSHNCKQHQS